MLLRCANVSHYKCIDDTGTVALEPDVTCLVGKNESGKTAFLEALFRLQPIPSGPRPHFDELYDYPRRRRASDRDRVIDTRPVQAVFGLEAEDLEALGESFGEGILQQDTVTVERGYDGRLYWHLELDEHVAARHLAQRVQLPKARLRGVTDLAKLAQRLDRMGELTESQQRLRKRLETIDLSRAVGDLLAERMPRFLYFDEYNILPGRFSIPYLQQAQEADLTRGERTALAFLRLAGVGEDDFLDGEYEARKAALELAANRLTDEMFEFWSQDRELRVEFDADYRPPRGDQPRKALRVDFDKPSSPELAPQPPFLEIRIWNERQRLSLNFSEKSNGFVWFFSFLAYFSQFRTDGGRLVLLLDEPGHSLHASAQADLLRFMLQRLAPKHQVIYTTHSPFMILTDALHKVRAVEDNGQGTRLYSDLEGVGEDTLMPLRWALGKS